MKAALIFPPATDPRGPHLGCPSLAAALRQAGAEAVHMDLDLSGLLHVLGPERLAEAASAARRSPPGMRPLDRRLVGRSEALLEEVPAALRALRDRERFFDPNCHAWARQTILDGLDLVCATAPGSVRYSLQPIRYDVDGIDTSKLSDLIRVTGDPDAELFREHWQRDVYPRLEREACDVVGISICNKQQIIPGLALARRLKERGHFVVIGGTVFTKFVKQLARSPELFRRFAHGVVVYEGETALLELLSQLHGARDLSRVPNLLYLEGNTVRVNRVHLEDVPSLPTPDFEGLPLADYLSPMPVLPILAGKGCYFNRCKFCDIPYINHISPKAYRARSPEQVVEDVRTLAERFGCRHFEITDEALAPRMLTQIADAFGPGAGELYSFVGYARLEPGFTPEVCRRVADMGMRKLFFGLESGCQKTLDDMDKGIDLREVRPVLQSCRDSGIHFHIFSMIGFPGEDEASARETFEFFETNADVIEHPGNSIDIHPFGMELRTAYFEACKTSGSLLDPAALRGDFVIGIEGDAWRNEGGMRPERVAELLSRFTMELHRLFKRFHNWPGSFWPMNEEYSIQYADRYRHRRFVHRTSLPERGAPERYRLRWSDAVWIERRSGAVTVWGRHGRATVGAGLHRMLRESTFRTIDEILAEGSGLTRSGVPLSEADFRALTDQLFLAGLLCLDVHARPAPDLGPTLAARTLTDARV